MTIEEQISQLQRRRDMCLDNLANETHRFSNHLREEFSPWRIFAKYMGLPLLIGAGVGSLFGRSKGAQVYRDPESDRPSILKAIIQKIMDMIQSVLHSRHSEEHDQPESSAMPDSPAPEASETPQHNDGSVIPVILGQIVEAVPWSQVFSALSDHFSSKSDSGGGSSSADDDLATEE
jgi:hypothetical protein